MKFMQVCMRFGSIDTSIHQLIKKSCSGIIDQVTKVLNSYYQDKYYGTNSLAIFNTKNVERVSV